MGRCRADLRATDDERRERLRSLVAHAYERVPFYRERFDRSGVLPSDIRTLGDIVLLPVIEKRDLADAGADRTTASGQDADELASTMTSGYSGEPLVIRRTRAEQALWARSWLEDLLEAGLRRDDRIASVFFPRKGNPDGVGLLSGLGLVHEAHIDCTLEPGEIREALRRARPTFLRGLTGVVDRVAGSMADGDSSISPRIVWVSGEVLTEGARRRIETALGASVHNAYGTHEVGLLASECPTTGLMHLGRPDLIVELVPPRGPAPEGAREIVVTALRFRAAPFIRYRLSDCVVPGPAPCPCGAPLPTLVRIDGRTIDYLELPDGRVVHPYRIVGPTILAAPWVRQYQLLQEAPDRIVLRLAPEVALPRDEHRRLSDAVVPVLGPRVRFRIDVVPHISRGVGGKARPVVTLAGPRPGPV